MKMEMDNQQTGGTRVVANSYSKSGDLLVTKEFFLGKEELWWIKNPLSGTRRGSPAYIVGRI